MGPTNNIGFLLQHLAFMLGRQSDQVLQERLGIGFSQFKILMVLNWNPSIQQKVIAENLGQTEASVSRQIKLLYEQGLLRTTINPANRRQHITALTNKGRTLAQQAPKVLREFHKPTFESLTEAERAQLLQLLQTMHRAACGQADGGCLKESFMREHQPKKGQMNG